MEVTHVVLQDYLGSGRMTVGSIAFDIIVSTFLFILAMYGTIMGGSGQVRFSQEGDVNKAMGVAPTRTEAE